VKILKVLLDAGLDPNEQVCHGRYDSHSSALQTACRSDNISLVRILVEAGADVNVASYSPGTPLQVAVAHEQLEMVSYLLDVGADINKHASCLSALISAASLRNSELVRILLSAGADVNYKDKDGETSLLAATVKDEGFPIEDVIATVETLLEAGAGVDPVVEDDDEYSLGGTVLERAALWGDIKLIEILLEAGASISQSTLCFATKSNNTQLVSMLLNAGANVDGRSRNVVSALRAAVDWENLDLVKFLLEAGADVNPNVMVNKFARLKTPLQAASYLGNIDLVRILLNAGARVNTSVSRNVDRDEPHVTALQDAVATGESELVEMLLEAVVRKNAKLAQTLLDAGAEVNSPARVIAESTPLYAAIEWGDPIVIQTLLDAGANINAPITNENGKTALAATVSRRDTKLIHSMWIAGVDVNNPSARLWGKTALETAVETGDIRLVRYLLDVGADTNDPQALLAAVGMKENIELVQVLLTARSHIFGRGGKSYGCTALQRAIRKRDLEIIRVLLDANIDVNAPTLRSYEQKTSRQFENAITYGETAFGTAIREDKEKHLPLIQMLLEAGADPNAIVTESPKHTALLAAIGMKNIAMAQLLIDAGADVNVPAAKGLQRTALQAAAELGDRTFVQILLKAGAEVNALPAAHGGATALQAAAIGGYIGIACLLINVGAEVNAPPAKSEGRTALEGAAEHGHIDMLQTLLDAGADLEGCGETQYTRALSFASSNGHRALRKLLESYRTHRSGQSMSGIVTTPDTLITQSVFDFEMPSIPEYELSNTAGISLSKTPDLESHNIQNFEMLDGLNSGIFDMPDLWMSEWTML
jgi:ankyrin repeat protein